MKSQNSQHTFQSEQEHNALWEYVRSLNPETMARLSQPDSQDVFQIIEQNIVGLLGSLPQDDFDVEISTSRESLSKMLASAMMSGYFLRNAEQRLDFETSLLSTQQDN